MLTDDQARDLLIRAADTIEVPPRTIPTPAGPPPRRTLLAAAAIVLTVGGAGAFGVALQHDDKASDPAGIMTNTPSAPTPDETPLPVPTGPQVLTKVVDLSPRVTTRGSGTRAIPLEDRPLGATQVMARIACLTPGRLTVLGAISVECTEADTRLFRENPDELGAGGVIELNPDQEAILVEADLGTRWRLVTTYVRIERTPNPEWTQFEEQLARSKAKAVPSSECTDLVAFTKRPEVIAFYANTPFYGPSYLTDLAQAMYIGCPTAAELEANFRRAQEMVPSTTTSDLLTQE